MLSPEIQARFTAQPLAEGAIAPADADGATDIVLDDTYAAIAVSERAR